MKKIFIMALMVVLYTPQVIAQQDPLYAQYINNPMVINPGYTGINNVLNASLSYRSQWAGLDGAPTTISFSGHSSFFENKIGGGLVIVRDEIGVNVSTQMNVTGSYKIQLGEEVFSFGLQAGVINLQQNNDELIISDPNDPLFSGTNTTSKFNFGAGVMLKGPNHYIGLSMPRMVNSKEQFGDLQSQVYSRHFYLGLGYVFIFGADLAFKPTALIKGVADAPLSVDASANIILREKYTVGVLTRNLETFGLLAMINFNDNLRVGYVFELPTGQSVGTNFTTHELSLTLDVELFEFHFLDKRYF